jgi:general secretion pathway protein D
LLLVCAILTALPWIASSATRVHGIEADATARQDRLLVFADGDLASRVERGDARTTHLILQDAVLDPSTPTRLAPKAGSAFDLATIAAVQGDPPEVRVTVTHPAGAVGRVTRRGSQLAFAFDRKGAAPGVAARRRPEEPEPTLQIRQMNANLRDVIVRLAGFVGMEFFFDESLSGRVSIDAPEPITKSDAIALIDALLLLKGFAALPTPGGIHKIVSLAGAQGAWVAELERNPDEVPLTTMIRLHEIDAGLVEQAIRPLIGESAVLIPHNPANALILAGPGHRLRRIADVVRELDEFGPSRLILIQLSHARAVETAAALKEAFEGLRLEVWPDERTNRLVVRGRPDRIEAVRAFVARVDRPADTQGMIQVVPVRYADADRIAEMLNDFKGGLAAPAQGGDLSVRGARSLLGRHFAVSVHAPTHALVVRADPQTMALIRELVAEVDQIPARIDVEVTVIEVTTDSSLALGFDAILPLIEPNAADDLLAFIVANPSAGAPGGNPLLNDPSGGLFAKIARTPLVVPVVNPATGEVVNVNIPRDTFAVTADEREIQTRVILRPKLSLLSGEAHEIFAGDNVPVPIAETGAVDPLEIRQNIERYDVGTRLRVEPTVGTEDSVQLKIDLEVSRVTGTLLDAAAGLGPTIRERTVESTIRLHSGESGVIALAMNPATLNVEVGTPFLRSIPFIGRLFRSNSERKLESNLLVIARAEIFRPEAEALTQWILPKIEGEEPDVAEAPPSP